MCIFVSARLQATAAPEAPAPMIRTSTVFVMSGLAGWVASVEDAAGDIVNRGLSPSAMRNMDRQE